MSQHLVEMCTGCTGGFDAAGHVVKDVSYVSNGVTVDGNERRWQVAERAGGARRRQAVEYGVHGEGFASARSAADVHAAALHVVQACVDEFLHRCGFVLPLL